MGLPANHKSYPWLAAGAALLLTLRLALSVGTFSHTIDEPCHIGAAISMIEAGKSVALVSHPPLARLVAAVPLWLDDARIPEYQRHTTVEKEDVGYALGTKVLFNGPTPYLRLLEHARLAMIIFPLLTLLYVYLLAKWLANDLVAMCATVFCSIDPTLLGHGMWIATDAASAAGFIAAIYHGSRWLRGGGWGAAAGAGVAVGLAVACKFSCLIVIPALALIALAGVKDSIRPKLKKILPQTVLVAVIAFTVLWGTYFLNIGPLEDQNVLGHSSAFEKLPAWVRNTPIPMPSFFLGVARLAAHNYLGQAAYLNGEVRTHGWWYYFPELLGIKSTLGFLAALAAALGMWIWSRQWNDWAVRATLLPAGLFLLVSMAGSIDIGIRHILPMIPLLYVFAAWQLARPQQLTILAACALIAVVETAAIHPDYLSYFNLIVGGPAQGDQYAADSNLDWGQDTLRLADWIKRNGNGRPYALRLSGQRNKPLLKYLGLNPDALDAPAHGGLLFISKNSRLIEGHLPWLAYRSRIAYVGLSIEVYDLSGPARDDEPEDVPSVDDPASRP